MPLYEYQCEACGQRFEVIQKFSDAPAETCRKCGQGPVQRLLSSPAIQFKGSGWYITDYSQKGKSSESKSDSTPKSDAAAGASGSDTKSESKSESSTGQSAPAKTPGTS